MATGLVTLYDAVRSMFVASGQARRRRASFAEDILPIFARMTDMQWVNEGFFLSNGFGSKEDWLTDENVARLADPGERTFHRALFEAVPQSGLSHFAARSAVPDMYGDHVNIPQQNVRQWLTVTPLQYAASRRLGGRPLRGRPRPRFHRSARPREPVRGGADARARPRVARVLPRGRVPPRNRSAVDAEDRDDVGPPVQAARALDRAGDRLRPDPRRATSSSRRTAPCRARRRAT